VEPERDPAEAFQAVFPLVIGVLALPVVGLVLWGLVRNPLLVAPFLVLALIAGGWFAAVWRRGPVRPVAADDPLGGLPRGAVLLVLLAGSALVFAAGTAVFGSA
jgi:hypothetical protein